MTADRPQLEGAHVAPRSARPTGPHADPSGEIWENPVTRERATILELPYKNHEGRATAELTALVGAQVIGEHRHPALVERFTVLEGELSVKLAGQTTVLRRAKRQSLSLAVARLVERERPTERPRSRRGDARRAFRPHD